MPIWLQWAAHPRRAAARSVGDGADRDPTGCWLADDIAAAARAIVESAGLVYVDRPYIAEVARGA